MVAAAAVVAGTSAEAVEEVGEADTDKRDTIDAEIEEVAEGAEADSVVETETGNIVALTITTEIQVFSVY